MEIPRVRVKLRRAASEQKRIRIVVFVVVVQNSIFVASLTSLVFTPVEAEAQIVTVTAKMSSTITIARLTRRSRLESLEGALREFLTNLVSEPV